MKDLTLPYRTRLVFLGVFAAALMGGSIGAAHAADTDQAATPAPASSPLQSTETSTSATAEASPPAVGGTAVVLSPSGEIWTSTTGEAGATAVSTDPPKVEAPAAEEPQAQAATAEGNDVMTMTAKPLPGQAAPPAQAAWAARIKKFAEMKAVMLEKKAAAEAKAAEKASAAVKRKAEQAAKLQLKKASKRDR